MPRPPGKRNPTYEQERTRLASSLYNCLLEPQGHTLSLRALASKCGVTPPTLRHYFTNRDGAVCAALAFAHTSGSSYRKRVEEQDLGSVSNALHTLLQGVVEAWRQHGLSDLHRAGLSMGLDHATIGPAYVQFILEPTLQAFETRISLHMKRNELRRADPRTASITLISPLLVALLHQDPLHGATCRPLDIPSFMDELIDTFLRAYAPPPSDERDSA